MAVPFRESSGLAVVLVLGGFVDPASQLAQECLARRQATRASLVSAGRGGVPMAPGGPLPSRALAATEDLANEGESGELPADGVDAGVASDAVQIAGAGRFVPATYRMSCNG